MNPSPVLPIAAATAALTFALCCGPWCCSSNPSSRTAPPAASRRAPATDRTAPSDADRTREVAQAEPPSAAAPTAATATIASGRLTTPAGEIRIGDPYDRLPAGLERERTSTEQCSEEGCETIATLELRHDGDLLATLYPSYDAEQDRFVDVVGELMVTSPRARTPEGLGPSVTMLAFYTACPATRIWYTYISDRFVVECPTHAKVQFELPPAAFKGDRSALGMTEIDELRRSDIDLDATIKSVRLY